MKKIFLSLKILGFGLSSNAFAGMGTAKPVCPEGANRRLDQDKTVIDRIPNGAWEEINRSEDWGNSRCSAPGQFCSKGDWFTWWYKVKPPVQDGAIEGEELGNKIPVGFDLKSKEYIYEEQK